MRRNSLRVFISHKGVDAEWAQRLGADLRSRGIHAWVDIWDMPPGKPLSDAMQDGVESADAMLLILTPASVSAIQMGEGWISFEVQAGEQRTVSSKGFRIIGVLKETCQPPLKLTNRLGRWIDFTREGEYDQRLTELVAWLRNDRLGPPVVEEDQPPAPSIVPRFDVSELCERIAEAEASISILATWIYSMPLIAGALLKAAKRGVTTRILLLAPESAYAEKRSLLLKRPRDHAHNHVHRNINTLRTFAKQDATRSGSPFGDAVRLRLYDAPPHLLIFAWDNTVRYWNLMQGRFSAEHPGFQVTLDQISVFDELHAEFEFLWKNARPQPL